MTTNPGYLHMSDVSLETVLDTLRDVVRGREDYVYTRPDTANPQGPVCLYVHPSDDPTRQEPGCLVGHVLYRLGVPLSALAEHEGHRASIVVTRLTDCDPKIAYMLDRAQRAQDDSETWGDALEQAERYAATAAQQYL
jgi:hypothetical protein